MQIMKAAIQRLRQLDRRLFWVGYGLAVLAVALVGGLAGLIFGYALELPRVDELERNRPSTVTSVLDKDGRVLGGMAVERRSLIRYQDIPRLLKNAVLAAEDASFFEHSGIDFRRVLVTLARNLLNWERKGASTITMQLSKLRFTSYAPTWKRKIQDALYAMEIEKQYSKEQILTFYFNQVYMGHGIYGMATAADFYFSKSLEELTLTECALLAGIIKWPPYYSPINSLQRSKVRRDYALRRMFNEGFIEGRESLDTALQEPVALNIRRQDPGVAPYVVETVRQELEKDYKTEDIWERGLRVHTSIDYDMQAAATQALREGLKAFDKERRDWEGAQLNILDQGKDLQSYRHPDWRQIFHPGLMLHGLVVESGPKEAKVKIGNFTALIGPEDVEWTKKKKVDQALRPGDVAVFTLEEVNRSDRTIQARLDRIPEVQGALMVIDNPSGAIRAMVGGFDYKYSEFNRATQALRQPGSIFKPFTYVVAMEEGLSPFDVACDSPVTFFDGLGRPYEPGNSDDNFKGDVQLYQALVESRNVPTLRLANRLGMEKVVEAASRFGIERKLPPYLPVAIGAAEVTLQEITSAFTVFANHGFRAKPHLIRRIENYDGSTLRAEQPREMTDVISPDVSAKMLFFLSGITQRPWGTAYQAHQVDRPAAGKTGTTDEYSDSWFVGFTPQITAGVWVGHETKKTLGKKVYGATLALPIWIDFFKKISDKLPVVEFEGVHPYSLADVIRIPAPEEGDDEPRPCSGDVQTESPTTMKVEDIPAPPRN